METATASEAPAPAPAAEAPAPGVEAAAPATIVTPEDREKKLLRYSRYVHVGSGAEKCEDGEDGSCGDPHHFHAFCRVVNPFQHEEARKAGMAAKARKLRTLRMEDSDERVIIENDLDSLRRTDSRSVLIEELVNKEWMQDQLNALQEGQASHEEFENIDDDRRRFRELEDAHEKKLAEDHEAQPPDELKMLREQFKRYGEAVDAALKVIQRPKYDALESRTMDEIIDLVLGDRIELEGDAEFNHVYGYWSWYYGTYRTTLDGRGKHITRYFASIDELREAEEEVIAALEETFRDLETARRRRSPAGNS